jgi:hypothetical protein
VSAARSLGRCGQGSCPAAAIRRGPPVSFPNRPLFISFLPPTSPSAFSLLPIALVSRNRCCRARPLGPRPVVSLVSLSSPAPLFFRGPGLFHCARCARHGLLAAACSRRPARSCPARCAARPWLASVHGCGAPLGAALSPSRPPRGAACPAPARPLLPTAPPGVPCPGSAWPWRDLESAPACPWRAALSSASARRPDMAPGVAARSRRPPARPRLAAWPLPSTAGHGVACPLARRGPLLPGSRPWHVASAPTRNVARLAHLRCPRS